MSHKSPVAIATALTLGTSYICTSTKDFQTQYARDFPFVRVAKGKNNFTCTVKEDFSKNGTYKCGLCVSNNANECDHTSAEHGPCISNVLFKRERCKYRTFPRDYTINNKGTIEEEVFIDNDKISRLDTRTPKYIHISLLLLVDVLVTGFLCSMRRTSQEAYGITFLLLTGSFFY